MQLNVVFNVKCPTKIGQDVRIVGCCPKLGNWLPKDGLRLETTPAAYPVWKSHRLSVPKDVQYKYVVVNTKRESEVKWEQVENRTILCTSGRPHDLVTVQEWFGNDSIQNVHTIPMPKKKAFSYSNANTLHSDSSSTTCCSSTVSSARSASASASARQHKEEQGKADVNADVLDKRSQSYSGIDFSNWSTPRSSTTHSSNVSSSSKGQPGNAPATAKVCKEDPGVVIVPPFPDVGKKDVTMQGLQEDLGNVCIAKHDPTHVDTPPRLLSSANNRKESGTSAPLSPPLPFSLSKSSGTLPNDTQWECDCGYSARSTLNSDRSSWSLEAQGSGQVPDCGFHFDVDAETEEPHATQCEVEKVEHPFVRKKDCSRVHDISSKDLLGSFISEKRSGSEVTVCSVSVQSGRLIDKITFHYSDSSEEQLPWGGTGGHANIPFVIETGREMIVAIHGRHGKNLDAIQFETNQGRKSPLYGNNKGGNPFSFKASAGKQIWSVVRNPGFCGTIADLVEKDEFRVDRENGKVAPSSGVEVLAVGACMNRRGTPSFGLLAHLDQKADDTAENHKEYRDAYTRVCSRYTNKEDPAIEEQNPAPGAEAKAAAEGGAAEAAELAPETQKLQSWQPEIEKSPETVNQNADSCPMELPKVPTWPPETSTAEAAADKISKLEKELTKVKADKELAAMKMDESAAYKISKLEKELAKVKADREIAAMKMASETSTAAEAAAFKISKLEEELAKVKADREIAAVKMASETSTAAEAAAFKISKLEEELANVKADREIAAMKMASETSTAADAASCKISKLEEELAKVKAELAKVKADREIAAMKMEDARTQVAVALRSLPETAETIFKLDGLLRDIYLTLKGGQGMHEVDEGVLDQGEQAGIPYDHFVSLVLETVGREIKAYFEQPGVDLQHAGSTGPGRRDHSISCEVVDMTAHDVDGDVIEEQDPGRWTQDEVYCPEIPRPPPHVDVPLPRSLSFPLHYATLEQNPR